MIFPTLAIIGAGNMGSSLLHGLVKKEYPSASLIACDPDKEKLIQLEETLHIHTTTDNIQAINKASVVLFAIKPQLFAQTVRALSFTLQRKNPPPLIISIAAGIRTVSIQSWIEPAVGTHYAIVRAMPNMAAAIGCSATALYANAQVTSRQREIAESILQAVGTVVWLDTEEQMDSVTALSGSGPAYFFLVMEALQEAALQLGLTAEVARALTLQTAFGAARMAVESNTPLAALRQQVTLPGGTTEAALTVLEENNVRGVFKKALIAAKMRSTVLALEKK